VAQAHDGGWPWWSGSPPCWRLRFSCMARPRSNILRFSSWEPTYWHWRQWYSTPLWLGVSIHSDWLFANVYRLPLTVIALIIAIGCALLFQDGEERRSALTVASVLGACLAGALYARLRRQPKSGEP